LSFVSIYPFTLSFKAGKILLDHKSLPPIDFLKPTAQTSMTLDLALVWFFISSLFLRQHSVAAMSCDSLRSVSLA